MKHCRALLMGLLALVAIPACAAVEVAPTLVRAGHFQAPDCVPEADPAAFNECICEANIKKAEVKGVSSEIAAMINEHLSMMPEKLAQESCEGKVVAPAMDGLKVNKVSADYEIVHQTDTVLTALVVYSTYSAGAEHPLEGTEGLTFSLTSGKLVDPLAHLEPDQISKADAFIKSELQSKYPAALYDEAKTRAEPYLTENGCDTCTIFYGKDGWHVRFQITAVAPYMVGEPEIIIPEEIIPPPEKLMTKS